MRLLISIFIAIVSIAAATEGSGPWLDLEGGGQSVGAPQGTEGTYGSLVDASEVPYEAPGLKRTSRKADHNSWGAGHMVSLLLNSAAEFERRYPGHVLHIGAVSQRYGGLFKGHKSHQNGLDADLLFIGRTRYESVLDSEGHVTDKFDRAGNWEFWRLLQSQKIQRDGKEIPVVSMILVVPEIKAEICRWVAENGLMEDPESRDLLKRIRPTEGHDAHFHIRIHCSPAHAACIPARDPGRSSKTGCEEFLGI